MIPGKSTWRPPPDIPGFNGTEIHVWRWLNRQGQGADEIHCAYLSAEERSRAARFIRAVDRGRFVRAHGMLRAILGSYLGCRPEKIVYQSNAYGKPALAGPDDSAVVRFNMAHTNDMVLVAVSASHDVGVDVEFRRAMDDMQLIIQRSFSPAERRFFASLTAEQLESEFFVYWTLKEAYIKGIGLGLSFPLEAFNVESDRSRTGPAAFYALIPDDGTPWQGLKLPLVEEYVGAVAAPSINDDTKFYDYLPVPPSGVLPASPLPSCLRRPAN